MIDISIIVPVYNIKIEYLRQCLDSLKKQEISDVEFIVVDDGSSPDVSEVCDDYESDGRFIIIHTENRGVSAARNTGLSIAKGKQVLFIDGDDYVESDLCAKCLQAINTVNADIIIFKLFSGLESSTTEDIRACTQAELNSILLSTISHEEPFSGYLMGSPCMKIYKKEIIDRYGLKFVEGLKKCQDRVFSFDYLSKCKNAYLFDYEGYHYVVNSNSVTNKYNKNIKTILDQAKMEFKHRIEDLSDCEYLEAFRSLCLRFIGVVFQLNYMNENNTDSRKIRVSYIVHLFDDDDYNDALKHGELSKAGKRTAVVLFLIRLKLYYLASIVGDAII